MDKTQKRQKKGNEKDEKRVRSRAGTLAEDCYFAPKQNKESGISSFISFFLFFCLPFPALPLFYISSLLEGGFLTDEIGGEMPALCVRLLGNACQPVFECSGAAVQWLKCRVNRDNLVARCRGWLPEEGARGRGSGGRQHGSLRDDVARRLTSGSACAWA